MRLNYSIKGVRVDREDKRIKFECWCSPLEVKNKRKKQQDRKRRV